MTDKESKQFIIDRTNLEIGCSNYIDTLLNQAAKEITAISYRYNIHPSLFKFSANKSLQNEVNEVLNRLRSAIYTVIETYSLKNNEDNRDFVLAWINRKVGDKTLKERISTYVNRFKYEIEAMVAAGLLFGIKQLDLIGIITNNLHNPWNSDLFKRAVKAKEAEAIRLANGGVSYGAGHSNVAANMLDVLSRYTVGGAIMELLGENMKEQGAAFFMSHRGSSYKCGECETNAEVLLPINMYSGGWHVRCMCWFTFFDETMNRI